ncbi:hypothetical protein DMH18_36700 [Streptomyces sp. WAC 06783]|nr:hypothetical protein DMH18_36700 [Streptomyces sp. WAC 06783]
MWAASPPQAPFSVVSDTGRTAGESRIRSSPSASPSADTSVIGTRIAVGGGLSHRRTGRAPPWQARPQRPYGRRPDKL